ncbi:unnamed protein product [Clonostachys byssicola]|uniref:AB hydrolase-1 domain-containing protein n=1 Tax=Clonostachys byssicola TaxID=160290 RepID=A0A9N9U2R9_9HYPO|nr:unnamed protein product [Clonostachys byssicola]
MSFDMRVADLGDDIRIAYVDELSQGQESKGVILLIHGFPQTSYQFRKVIPGLVASGYRVIAPDYRGAGMSSKPVTGYTKSTMATDLRNLLTHLLIVEKVHVVGHDIGGMIAWAFATRFPDHTASVIWGECPLPGTRFMYECRTVNAVQKFHFAFHAVSDLPEALVAGREDIYLKHFYGNEGYKVSAIDEDDVNHYAQMYRRPGALRSAFNVYRAFAEDIRENQEWIDKNKKCSVRALSLSGALSTHTAAAEGMMYDAHEAGTFSVAELPETGHYLAEESPEAFNKAVLEFIEQKQAIHS